MQISLLYISNSIWAHWLKYYFMQFFLKMISYIKLRLETELGNNINSKAFPLNMTRTFYILHCLFKRFHFQSKTQPHDPVPQVHLESSLRCLCKPLLDHSSQRSRWQRPFQKCILGQRIRLRVPSWTYRTSLAPNV